MLKSCHSLVSTNTFNVNRSGSGGSSYAGAWFRLPVRTMDATAFILLGPWKNLSQLGGIDTYLKAREHRP